MSPSSSPEILRTPRPSQSPTAGLSKVLRSTYHVSAQVNAENGNCSQGKRDVSNDEDQERSNLGDVTG